MRLSLIGDFSYAKETPAQLQRISALPIPDPQTLPEDLQKYMTVCEDKLGMVPNAIKAFSFRPEKLRTFIAKYNELMLSDGSSLTRDWSAR